MPQLEQINTYASQVFWLVLCFGVLYFVLWRSALPRITEVLQERRARIEQDVRKAEDLKREAEGVLAAYEAATAKARTEAHAILRESEQRFAAEAAKRHEELGRRLAAEAAESEARIAAAHTAALANVEAIATELAEAATRRLAGFSVDEPAARAAVAAVMQERR